ncbi:MAG TPA: hypothetical protein VE914_23760 [Candidatus Angelobacter sp.]|nr:hypothetical protein [Candidatus Angelobacter sp.]
MNTPRATAHRLDACAREGVAMRGFPGAGDTVRRMAVAILVAVGIGAGFSDWSRADDVADRLRDLRIVSSAIRLEGECVGFACTRSLYYAAYARIVAASDLTVDQMVDAYDRALPAGRVYLSAAILKRDRERGQEVLRELAKSSTPLWKQYSWEVEFTTAGSAATFVLANNGLPSFW